VKYDQNIYAPAAIMSRGTREKHKKKNRGISTSSGQWDPEVWVWLPTCLLTKCVYSVYDSIFCSPSKIVFYDPEFGSATKLQ